MIRGVALVLTLLASVLAAYAQTPGCEDLSARERQLAGQLLGSLYLYECCDDTIAACLEARPTCSLAVRLADNVCRRVAAGQDEKRIRRALSRRARSMVGGGEPAEIDLDATTAVGREDAPVTVVVYACARCPYCSKLVPALHERVTTGGLSDQVRLAFRIFPIRGHEGSTEGGLGFAAAAALGGFWPYLLHAYGHFDAFSAAQRFESAATAGLDSEEFTARMSDPQTRATLVESKKEGLVNGVAETPTLFINGRRWVGDLAIEEVVDAIEEEVARVGGKQWVTP